MPAAIYNKLTEINYNYFFGMFDPHTEKNIVLSNGKRPQAENSNL